MYSNICYFNEIVSPNHIEVIKKYGFEELKDRLLSEKCNNLSSKDIEVSKFIMNLGNKNFNMFKLAYSQLY